jgi:hypothetical protein
MNTIFTKKDFNSSDGMMTSIWGPPMWHVLHTISFNYPCKPTKQDKIKYKHFILSIKDILPCKYCRENIKNNFKQSNFSDKVFTNRYTFSHWLYSLHEIVNKMLGKKSGLTYNKVKDIYEQFRSRCIQETDIAPYNIIPLEKGCVTPYYGKKTKCVLEIVPKKSKKKSFKIKQSCVLKRVKSPKQASGRKSKRKHKS